MSEGMEVGKNGSGSDLVNGSVWFQHRGGRCGMGQTRKALTLCNPC